MGPLFSSGSRGRKRSSYRRDGLETSMAFKGSRENRGPFFIASSMAKLTKDISYPGEWLATSVDGRGRVKAKIDAQRQKNWAETAGRMLEKGLQIPAPYLRHYVNARVATKLNDPPATVDELQQRVKNGQYRNFGKWTRFWYDEEKDKLFGELDVPDHLADDAKQLKVSPLVLPNHKDGDGEEWGEHIAHVCLTNKPVIAKQDDFQEVPDARSEEPALAAGFSLEAAFMDGAADDTDDHSSADVLRLVGEIWECGNSSLDWNLGDMPTTATEALAQIKGAIAAMKTKDDDDQQTKPQPIAMSLDSPVAKAFAKTLRTDYEKRITALCNSGRVTKQYAEQTLMPKLSGFQLSLDDSGEPQESVLGTLLDALEANQPLATSVAGGMEFAINENELKEVTVPDDTPLDPRDLPDDRMKALAEMRSSY